MATFGSSQGPGGTVSSTLADFSQPGTQPGTLLDPISTGQSCAACHGGYDYRVEPYQRWASSMMAQASRDPIFHAALAIAEQDADFAGDLCWRCHAPSGWTAGRANPTDGSALNDVLGDLDGVNCNFCHRMVDPVHDPANPVEDPGILAALTDPVVHEPHNGQYTLDDEDRRRGPYDLPNFFLHEWRESPFHRESLLCAHCHDVSNPLLEKQPGGGYLLGNLDEAHPTDNKHDQFPIERTFSEWAASDYALMEIDTEGRFGGRKEEVATCQDCHMPDAAGSACIPGLGEDRLDLPLHDFNGANSWVLRAVHEQYDSATTGLTDSTVDVAIQRNLSMLHRAADLEAFVQDGQLITRVINQTGHKLPTGYGEGRRMWLNVQFRDAGGNTIQEHGAYDNNTAVLVPDTKVYEIKHGIDAAQSAATGEPVGPSFHFVLNNVTEKDNRIPPRGYDSAMFEAIGAPVIGTTISEQHYWDDSSFAIPAAATQAWVFLYHQTTTKEYIEFLRDENTTNNKGQEAYDLWVQFGKSKPVMMTRVAIDLATDGCPEPRTIGLARETSFGDPPTLTASGTPTPGGNLTLHVTGGVPGKRAALLLGDVATRTPLPHGGWRHVGGNLSTVTVVLLDGNGEADIPITVPAASGGEQRYYQVLFRDPGAPGSLGATPALAVELCD